MVTTFNWRLVGFKWWWWGDFVDVKGFQFFKWLSFPGDCL